MRKYLVLVQLMCSIAMSLTAFYGIYVLYARGATLELAIVIAMAIIWPAHTYNHLIELKDHKNDD